MKGIAGKIHKIAENPYLNLFAGILFIWTGFLEAGETIFDDIINLNLGVHHGAIVFGTLHALRSIPEVMIGLKLIDEGNEN